MAGIPKSQTPDGRLFTPVGPNSWVSNRQYKTQKGAEAFLYKTQRQHARRNVLMQVVDVDGIYRVLATWIGRERD